MQNPTRSHFHRLHLPKRGLLAVVLGVALVLAGGSWALVGMRSSEPPTSARAAEPSDTPSDSEPSRTASASVSCAARPDATSTGAAKVERTEDAADLSTDGVTVERVSFSGPLKVTGVGVTLRNVEVAGVVTVEANDVMLDHITAKGVVVSGAAGVTVRDSDLSGGGTAVTITGGEEGAATGVTLAGNYVHDPAPVGATRPHGTRVVGEATVSIRCSSYDLDGLGESVLAFESARSGRPRVTVEDTWLGGGTGYTVVTEAHNLTLRGNVFDTVSPGRLCRNAGTEHLVQQANSTSGGAPVEPCGLVSPSPSRSASTSTPTEATTSTPSGTPRGNTSPSVDVSANGQPPSPVASPPVPVPTGGSTGTSAIEGCAIKPSASNTGATGSLRASSKTVLDSGQSLSDVNVAELEIRGDNVTVRNVQVNGYLLVLGDNVTISHVTAQGIGISSASKVLVEYSDIGYTEGDGIHVTSDRGAIASGVTLRYNYVHDPRVPDTAHYDGTQVRGVNGLNISCSVYDPGPYRSQFNAAIYLEWANGGDTNVVVERNWIYGFGFSVMVDARSTTIRNNRIGGDLHWKPCYLGDNSGAGGFISSGNVWDSSDSPVNLCGLG